MSDTKTTLTDADIQTGKNPTRRRALGLMALGGAAMGAGVMRGSPAHAQGADIDNGTWTDAGDCPRGPSGTYSGVTDSDDGAITDLGGYGRGTPYC